MSVTISGLIVAGSRTKMSARIAVIMQIREEIVSGRQSLEDIEKIIQTTSLPNDQIHFLMEALTQWTEKQAGWNSFVRTPENNERLGCLLIDLFYSNYITIVRGHRDHYYGQIDTMFRNWFVGHSFSCMYQSTSKAAVILKLEQYTKSAGLKQIDEIKSFQLLIARY